MKSSYKVLGVEPSQERTSRDRTDTQKLIGLWRTVDQEVKTALVRLLYRAGQGITDEEFQEELYVLRQKARPKVSITP